MIAFEITHTDRDGHVKTYDGIFNDSIEAIKDCVANYGVGKIKVIKKEEDNGRIKNNH